MDAASESSPILMEHTCTLYIHVKDDFQSVLRSLRALMFIYTHSRHQRPRSFWSAPRIATSGPVQRHSGFEWLCKHNRLRPDPIRFVRLDSEPAQSDGKSVNAANARGLAPGGGWALLELTDALRRSQKSQ